MMMVMMDDDDGDDGDDDIDDDIDDDGDDIDNDDDDDDGDNDDDDDDIIYLTIQDGAIKSWSRCQTSISTAPHYQVPSQLSLFQRVCSDVDASHVIQGCRGSSIFAAILQPLMSQVE